MARRGLSQCERVWRALERYPQGVCAPDFLLPNIIDGGAPITRLAARIKDLRADGLDIVNDGERYGCTVYKLPQPETVPIPDPDISQLFEQADESADALFDMPAKPRSPYEEAA